MIYALNIIDERKPSDVTNGLDHRLDRTHFLRSVILYLISFKHPVNTNDKHQGKQWFE